MPIAKVTVGKSAYGCLAYVLNKDKAQLLDTNCAGDTPAVLAREFDAAFQPHYRNRAARHTENFVAHFSIAFPFELERPKLEAIAHRFMALMGFDPVMNQFVLAQHHDTDDCHIHLIENRIRLDGQVVSDSFQQRRTEVAMRTLEEAFDLPRLKNSWEVDVRAPKVAEVRLSRETGKPIPRRVLQETIERCVVGTGSLVALQQKLQQSGVTLNATPRDDRSWALLYQLALEGEKVRTFSATKLGKRYTKRGLASTFGISFGEAEATAATLETTTPVLPVVLPTIEPMEEPEVSATNANASSAGFWVEPGNVSGDNREGLAGPASFGHALTQGSATDGESFGHEFAETIAESDNVTPETIVEAEIPLTQTSETVRWGQELDGSKVEPEGFWVETGNVSDPGEGFWQELREPETGSVNTEASFRQALTESVESPVAKADAFRQQLEQLAAQLASTQTAEWTDDLTPTQTEARAESLNAVLQWTQHYVATLEQRAIGIGLQNASDQERWEAFAAQAQQRGLRDPQQVETAVTALACQQGYKTKTIVRLLQQSPRVQAALKEHDYQTVTAVLTRSVVQVREALQQHHFLALRAVQQRGQLEER